MDQQHKIWAIRAGIGGAVCALLTAWMVPNTTPTAKPSVIAGMSGTAEAQKPTYSAVPDSAIPSWAASLQQNPAEPQAAMAQPPQQVADAGPMPVMPNMASPDPASADEVAAQDAPVPAPAPPPAVTVADPPPAPVAAPAPRDDYQARRAQWQARLGAVMQGQGNPG
ncbi:hypothetical protein HZF05_01755 [Sphingomonas sp. CGMCC 1.13654]|uniref:Uncharacterized protein n=1 Tax=Sphingomonas chungangi TaxID=2683589 RepID=A0A838L0E4_9SPHN|nr:hypothetical protein [Sphingomonas chungangi]MBA2932811.1 hypothetical protein [Sphingomonas chungangi]MVW56433.1 hypothetical protein [Sphingomonas chungangi]